MKSDPKMPDLKVVLVDIDKVIPYARNPRNNETAVQKVAAAISEFGWQQPIVVDSEMTVIVGHTRLEAARQLGHTQVPVHIAKDMDPNQAKAYRIADNRTGENAEWDEEKLKGELLALREVNYPLQMTGFDMQEIDTRIVEVEPEVGRGGRGGNRNAAAAREELEGEEERVILIGARRIPVTERELKRAIQRVEQYLEEAGTLYGFVAQMLGIDVIADGEVNA